MTIWTTARRTATVAAVAAPLALMASPAFAQQVADVAAATSISGVAWLDQDSDGLRDAGEPGFAGLRVYLEGTDTDVLTTADGRYTFTGLRPGLKYRVGTTGGARDGLSWSPQRSTVRNGSDFSASTGLATFHAGEQNADSGLVRVANDFRAEQITVEFPDRTTKPAYQVGDVVDIVGSAYFEGNAHDQVGIRLTLPDGMRKVERRGELPLIRAEDKPNEVTGYESDRLHPTTRVSLGARVVVEKPIDAADIRLSVWKGWFGESDTDPTNDDLTRSFSAAVAPGPAIAAPNTTGPNTTGRATVPAGVAIPRAGHPAGYLGASTIGLFGLGGSLLAGGGAALWRVRRNKA